jgi:hypothetical protein
MDSRLSTGFGLISIHTVSILRSSRPDPSSIATSAGAIPPSPQFSAKPEESSRLVCLLSFNQSVGQLYESPSKSQLGSRNHSKPPISHGDFCNINMMPGQHWQSRFPWLGSPTFFAIDRGVNSPRGHFAPPFCGN